MSDTGRSIKEYADIIDMPRPISHKYPRMDISDRAAQFAPFAALTGFHDSVDDAAKRFEDGAGGLFGPPAGITL